MSSPIVFVGWGSDDLVPGFYAQEQFAQGNLTGASLQRRVLVSGTKTSAGTATPDQDLVQIFSEDDARAKLGARSELCRMARQTILTAKYYGGDIELWALPVAEAGGAAAATATLTLTGTATGAGTLRYWIDGDLFEVTIAVGDTASNVGANAVIKTANNQDGSCTGGNSSGVVTFTRASKGARGNNGAVFLDNSQLAAGITAALSGGSALTGNNGVNGVRFTAGSGVETMTTSLGIIVAQEFNLIAAAQNDSTSAAAWMNQINTQYGITVGILQMFVMGSNGVYSAAQSLAQTTLNAYRGQVVHYLNGENTPAELAAAMVGMRASNEFTNPHSFYDDYQLPYIAPQRNPQDNPSHATRKTAILNSVTELYTQNGKCQVVRSITTYSLFQGATPDTRCLDTYYVAVPDWGRKDAGIRWTTGIKPNNQYADDNPAVGDPEAPAGVWNPARATSFLLIISREYEANGWLTQVTANPPTSFWNNNARRVESEWPMHVRSANHQFGVSILAGIAS